MTSSAEIWVVNKLVELSERCGVHPIDADVCFNFVDAPQTSPYSYVMGGVEPAEGSAEEAKVKKMWSLLGLDEFGKRQFKSLDEVKEVVEQALSLAPRIRHR